VTGRGQGQGYGSGEVACGAGYNDGEAQSHREHMRSLREMQQYHRRNPVKDSNGDLSDLDEEFDDAFM
jgi:hypothetical protein